MSPIKLASFTADFSQTKRFKVELFPSSPVLGQKFQITVWATDNYQIQSAYGFITNRQRKLCTEKIEILPTQQEPEFPVKRVISQTLSTPLLSKLSREIVYNITDPFPADLQDRDDLVGSLKLRYVPSDRQIFIHSALNRAGEYLIFAIDTNGCYQEIPFNVGNESVQDNIVIEGHNANLGGDYTLRVYPVALHELNKKGETPTFAVIADKGTLIGLSPAVNSITDELVALSGQSLVATKYPITTLTGYSVQGQIKDADGFVINPEVTLFKGQLSIFPAAYGQIKVSYGSAYRLYNYFAELINPGRIFGTVSALVDFETRATFAVPIPDELNGDREDVIVVYREVIVQGEKVFEMPPNWPTTNTYPSYPAALEENRPVIGDAFATQQWIVEAIFVEKGGIFSDLPVSVYYRPTTGEVFADVKWKLTNNIPASPTATINANMIAILNTRLAELITKYNIV